jgi:NAD(P)-dependent dehydrogenase (short-subunit alcohol dehydrogenase family)
MRHQGSGAIVNNASVGALTGNPGIGSYIASKHGVVGLTRTAALEYVRHGIRVNAVNPGLIDTQIARDVVNGSEQAYDDIAKNIPIARAGRPEEIAAAVLWLCSPGASYVVGHALTVDGGMTVAWRRLVRWPALDLGIRIRDWIVGHPEVGRSDSPSK